VILRALSLWQPWASLIAVGAKCVETRGWGSLHRDRLAIHAAKRWTSTEREFLADLLCDPRLSADQKRALSLSLDSPLAFGSVVAVVDLVDVRRMDDSWCEAQTDLERLLGAHEPGRYAWILSGVRPLRAPVPVRGRQGLWTLTEQEAQAVCGPSAPSVAIARAIEKGAAIEAIRADMNEVLGRHGIRQP
jgi:hypothetical protein